MAGQSDATAGINGRWDQADMSNDDAVSLTCSVIGALGLTFHFGLPTVTRQGRDPLGLGREGLCPER